MGGSCCRRRWPRRLSPDDFVALVGQGIREMMKQYPDMAYEGVGVSLPGRIDLSSQRFVFAPNLGWKREDLKQQLEAATGLAVELENEANACALAEFWFGKHAEDARNLIAVAVSEGIGVGMVLNGGLLRGTSGLAGEFGHVSIAPNGPKCACGNHGCWEVYASNTAAVRYYNEAIARNARFTDLESPRPRILMNWSIWRNTAIPRRARRLTRWRTIWARASPCWRPGWHRIRLSWCGEVTRLWERVEPVINEVVRRRTLADTPVRIMASGPAPLPRLRGIIALVLQKRFGAPMVA